MKQSISIVGGGGAGLCLAAFLDTDRYDVTIYEKNKSCGRKFLVAGDGGFNLTHSEPIDDIIKKYTPSTFLSEALLQFDNVAFREWLATIGIETFVGSSKRIFPVKGIKPIEVLNAILKVLSDKKVSIQYDYKWMGWAENNDLLFEDKENIKSDYSIFALGGGSWKVTGSDGSWISQFEKSEIATSPFLSSNCGFKVDWGTDFLSRNEGKPLKNIAIKCKGKSLKGEMMVTQFGLEGSAIYALSPEIRHEIKYHKKAVVDIDLKPMLDAKEIQHILEVSTRKVTDKLKKNLKLSSTQIDLLKITLTREEYITPALLAQKIKVLPVNVLDLAPIDEAISTVGGISLETVDSDYQLLNTPNNYCIGEMLDWDAPTGGYLLQGCFSMGHRLAIHLNQKGIENTTTFI